MLATGIFGDYMESNWETSTWVHKRLTFQMFCIS